jgi:hypothetical protein
MRTIYRNFRADHPYFLKNLIRGLAFLGGIAAIRNIGS